VSSVERFDERVAEATEAHKLATELRTFVGEDAALEAFRETTDYLAEALECAVTCEAEADLDANIAEAVKTAKVLDDMLTAALGRATRNEPEDVEAIADARSSLREIAAELGELSKG
jgi:hypothetical protein